MKTTNTENNKADSGLPAATCSNSENKENGLNLRDINPRVHEKYSPNLYKYLNHKRNQYHAAYDRVYKDDDGTLWLGNKDDFFFSGVRLLRVLSVGVREQSASYPRKSWVMTEVKGFWSEYLKIGRCAIDRAHATSFLNADRRYDQHGDNRTCRWCGAKQVLKSWEETITRHKWESLNVKALPPADRSNQT